MVTLAVATDAVATHVCSWCRHGYVSGAGSSFIADILLADDGLQLQFTPGSTTFFDAKASTTPGQYIQCTYDPQDGTGEIDALCSYPEENGVPGISCNRFEIEGCAQQGNNLGTRTSLMSCNTPGAGCTGKIYIFHPSNLQTPLRTINIGTDLPQIVGTNQCNSEFPTTSGPDGLKKTVMGKIVQIGCTSKQDPWDPNEQVSRMVVRTDLNDNGIAKYLSGTTALAGVDATCSPDDGFPAISCTNFGIVRSTFPASSAACSTANLRCGQKSNGDFGPAPSACTFDSSSGQCTCTCPKCDPVDGLTLVNVGVSPAPTVGGRGNYVVSDVNRTSTAMCDVRIGGN